MNLSYVIVTDILLDVSKIQKFGKNRHFSN